MLEVRIACRRPTFGALFPPLLPPAVALVALALLYSSPSSAAKTSLFPLKPFLKAKYLGQFDGTSPQDGTHREHLNLQSLMVCPVFLQLLQNNPTSAAVVALLSTAKAPVLADAGPNPAATKRCASRY